MVGDDPVNDIIPANKLGMHTYQVVIENSAAESTIIDHDHYGKLDDLYTKLRSGWLLA